MADDKFIGEPSDLAHESEGWKPAPQVLDVDGDGVVTATALNGKWTSTNPDLLNMLELRQLATGYTDDGMLVADAREYLGIGDDE